MEEIIIKEGLLAAGVALLSLTLSIFVIRLVANVFILAVFLLAIIVPPAWIYVQRSQGIEIDQALIIVGSAAFAFFMVLSTVPLWPVSTLMQWRGKKERREIEKLQKKVKEEPIRTNRISPSFDDDDIELK